MLDVTKHESGLIHAKLDFVASEYYDGNQSKASRAINLFIGRYDAEMPKYAHGDYDGELHSKFTDFCDFYGDELFDI